MINKLKLIINLLLKCFNLIETKSITKQLNTAKLSSSLKFFIYLKKF